MAYVNMLKMQIEIWQGRANHHVDVANSTWDEIWEAINSLDGHKRTLLSLVEGVNAYMLIGGDPDKGFIVNTTSDNCEFYSLVISGKPTEEVLITIGGQEGNYKSKHCVPLPFALRAARTYFETREQEESLCWERV